MPPKNWLKKRRSTLYVICAQQLLAGVEYTLVIATLWLYIKSMTADELRRKIFFGLIMSSYCICGSVLSVTFGKIMDKHRCMKEIVLFSNFLAIVGNLLYSAGISVWFLLLGRILASNVSMLQPIIASEVSRVYEKEKVASKVAFVIQFTSIGMVVGPPLNFVFMHVDLCIKGWHITYLNAPTLLVSLLYALSMIVTILFMHNLSKEYDLKVAMYERIGSMESSGNSENCNQKKKYSIDFCIVAVLSFLQFFSVTLAEVWNTIIIIDIQHFTVKEINIIYIIQAGTSITLMMFVSWAEISWKSLFGINLFCIACIPVTWYIYFLLTYVRFNYGLGMTALASGTLLTSLILTYGNSYLVPIVSQLVSSSRLSYYNGLRMTATMIGGFTATLFGAFLLQFSQYVVVIVSTFSLFMFVIMFWRKHAFQNPKVAI